MERASFVPLPSPVVRLLVRQLELALLERWPRPNKVDDGMNIKRKLDVLGGGSVNISIEIPTVCDDGSGDYECWYNIEGLDNRNYSSFGVGIDAIQALILTMELVGNIVFSSEFYRAGSLSWVGGVAVGDLGLPTAERG